MLHIKKKHTQKENTLGPLVQKQKMHIPAKWLSDYKEDGSVIQKMF